VHRQVANQRRKAWWNDQAGVLDDASRCIQGSQTNKIQGLRREVRRATDLKHRELFGHIEDIARF
jgi:hypothetical protein